MGQLLVVRHGQARLFTDDYDRLSELGVAQAGALAGAWMQDGIRPDQVWTGTLQRQVSTAESVGAGMGNRGQSWPAHRMHEGLNEYPAEEIMATLGKHLAKNDRRIAELAAAYDEAAEGADRYRHFHRLLAAVIARWVGGNHEGCDVPTSWEDWSGGVRRSLVEIMAAAGPGETVAVFTSGGVIGVSVQSVLEAPDIKAAELNWRVHNASVTRYTFSGARVSLDRFNDVAHLPAEMLTYR